MIFVLTIFLPKSTSSGQTIFAKNIVSQSTISSAVLQTGCAINCGLSIGDPNGPANQAIIGHRRVVGSGELLSNGI